MTVIKAHFDGRVFVPDEPVDLPANVEVALSLRIGRETEVPPPTDGARPLSDLLERLGGPVHDPDWPADGAKEADLYLYGTPKREEG